jgi:hypothetical protein
LDLVALIKVGVERFLLQMELLVAIAKAAQSGGILYTGLATEAIIAVADVGGVWIVTAFRLSHTTCF